MGMSAQLAPVLAVMFEIPVRRRQRGMIRHFGGALCHVKDWMGHPLVEDGLPSLWNASQTTSVVENSGASAESSVILWHLQIPSSGVLTVVGRLNTPNGPMPNAHSLSWIRGALRILATNCVHIGGEVLNGLDRTCLGLRETHHQHFVHVDRELRRGCVQVAPIDIDLQYISGSQRLVQSPTFLHGIILFLMW